MEKIYVSALFAVFCLLALDNYVTCTVIEPKTADLRDIPVDADELFDELREARPADVASPRFYHVLINKIQWMNRMLAMKFPSTVLPPWSHVKHGPQDQE